VSYISTPIFASGKIGAAYPYLAERGPNSVLVEPIRDDPI
jgi:hypothetical protein